MLASDADGDGAEGAVRMVVVVGGWHHTHRTCHWYRRSSSSSSFPASIPCVLLPFHSNGSLLYETHEFDV